ncbi:MAG: MazG nucleotide pyrophosphohydrolase domain-containing protein, partial [bacterium]|nr:MazG nucleotide pyrophosphohydrolase domain-containing protein [bacterium]
MLPALLRAHRVQAKAAASGFDWEQVSSVWEKLEEEIGELKNAVEQNDPEGIEEEFGDLMFTMVNLSRFLGVNPEDSLRKSVDKFSARFREVERSARKAHKKMVEMTLAEMDEIWDQIKSHS